MRVVRETWGTSVTVRIETGRQALVVINTNAVVLWRSGAGLDLSSQPYGLTATSNGDDAVLATDYAATWSVLVI